jgi:prepilin-type N-terminal cleavage/methylation domain-containing protein
MEMNKVTAGIETVKRCGKREEDGFTLVEILVAMAILSIAFVALAAMQLTATVGNSTSNKLTTAVSLAQDKMEELISLDYDDDDLLDSNTDNNRDLRSITDTDNHNDAVGVYRRTWNVADGLPIPGTKTVVVIVTFPPGDDHRVFACSVVRRSL